MRFADTQTPAGVTLLELIQGATLHSELGGLDADDHELYLNSARHTSVHGASYNAALQIPPDGDGNATLGAHTSDGGIHPDKTGQVSITGQWTFEETPILSGAGLSFENGTDASVLSFDDVPFDAAMQYNPGTRQFEFNRELYSPFLESAFVDGYEIQARTSLSGRVGGVRSAEIEGFTTIEGIAHADLLSRSRDEDVTGAWDFVAHVDVASSDDSTVASASALAVDWDARIETSSPLSDARRAALASAVTFEGIANAAINEAVAAGASGKATVASTTLSGANGAAVGVLGEAESFRNTFAAIGVAGAALPSASGTRRIGVLGSVGIDGVRENNALPPGDHAGVFVGDVDVRDTLTVTAVAIRVVNGGDEIELGDAVMWNGAGTVTIADAASSATSAIAGIALDHADPEDALRIVIAGIAEVKTTAALDAGDGLEWNGTGAVVAAAGSKAPIGTAAEGYAGGGQTLVKMQVLAEWRP